MHSVYRRSPDFGHTQFLIEFVALFLSFLFFCINLSDFISLFSSVLLLLISFQSLKPHRDRGKIQQQQQKTSNSNEKKKNE